LKCSRASPSKVDTTSVAGFVGLTGGSVSAGGAPVAAEAATGVKENIVIISATIS
jgi:hypothetical protein